MLNKKQSKKKTKEEKIPIYWKRRIISKYITSLCLLIYASYWTAMFVRQHDNTPTMVLMMAIILTIVALTQFIQYGIYLSQIKDITETQEKVIQQTKDMTEKELSNFVKQLQNKLENEWDNKTYWQYKAAETLLAAKETKQESQKDNKNE